MPTSSSRTTPSWKEFQPRLGFAYDVRGDATLVVRGGYGLFYDQIFQNLTIFSMTQSGPEFYSQIARLHQLQRRRRPAAELPLRRRSAAAAAGVHVRRAAAGLVRPHQRSGRRRIRTCTRSRSASRRHSARHLGAVERLRAHAGLRRGTRAGDQPADPQRLRSDVPGLDAGRCALRRRRERRATSTRRSSAPAWAPNRLGQINMIGTTNESQFDSWTTTLQGRGRRGRPVAQLRAGELARVGRPADGVVQRQRHRDHARAAVRRRRVGTDAARRAPSHRRQRRRSTCRRGFQVSPIVQWASSRPYTPVVGFDINGDGQTNILDRLCEGTSLDAVFAARGNLTAIRALNPNGCTPRRRQHAAIGLRRQPRRQHRGAQRPLLQRRPARRQELRASTPSDRCASTSTSSTCSTPRTCRSRCGPSRAPRRRRRRSCSRCRSTARASDRRSAVRSRRRSAHASSSSRAIGGRGDNGSARKQRRTEVS